jgi:PKD repeat protein
VGSSPTVVDGTVYVGSGDGNLYAVNTGHSKSSQGSRVLQGTLGHHNVFAEQGPTQPGDENTAPSAGFTYTPPSPTTSDTVTLDASGSSDSDGLIQSYRWEFGDGTTATGETATHSYGSSGDYTVTLTVTDDDGATDTESKTISVSDLSAAPAAVSSSDVSIGDVGDTGNSTITVDAENGLSVADVNVSVDTSVARITGVSAGDDINTGDSAVQFRVTSRTEGSVAIEYTTISGTGSLNNFEFAEVEFERRSQGTTPIRLDTDNWAYLEGSGSSVSYPRVAEDEGRITQAFFVDPIMGEFRGPPQSIPPSQGGFHDRLVEDIDGDGDPTDVGPTVTAFGELIRGNDLGLTDTQARKLNWNEDSPATEVTVADMVTLFGEKIRSD